MFVKLKKTSIVSLQELGILLGGVSDCNELGVHIGVHIGVYKPYNWL